MTSVLAPPVPETPQGFQAESRRHFRGIAAIVGLFGFVVSAAGSWIPSYWGDEAASVLSAERSLPSLFRMLGNVDAVHGAYYFFLHFWVDLFGTSEFATRLPSAIAVGIAAAGTAVLARELTNVRVAILAGIVFSVLPRVTYMGAEARSFAFAAAISVWLTVLLIRNLRASSGNNRVQFGRWLAYAVLLSLGVYMFMYVLLLVMVHALLLVLMAGTAAQWRAWLLSALAGVALALPVLYWGIQERDQIEFLSRRPRVDVFEAAVHQWFGKVPLAVAAWVLVLVAVATVFVLHRERIQRMGTTSTAVLVMLAWMVVPTTVLLVGTDLLTPMYALRYLSFSTPAVAIAVALGVACFRSRALRAVALLVVIALAAPTYLAQRTEFAKNRGADFRQAAAAIDEMAEPGDAVVFDESIRPSRKPRLALRLYPDAFEGLVDVTLEQPYDLTDHLWDDTVPLADAADRLNGISTVWLLQNRGSREMRLKTDITLLEQRGFAVASTTPVHRTVIVEMTR